MLASIAGVAWPRHSDLCLGDRESTLASMIMRFVQEVVAAAGRVCLRADTCVPAAARRHSTRSSRDTQRHRLDFISLLIVWQILVWSPAQAALWSRLQQRQRAGCAPVNTRMYVGICCSGKPHTFEHVKHWIIPAPFLINALATFPYCRSFRSSTTMTITVTQALLSDSS